MGVKITDLGAATLPLAGTEEIELAVSETESRKITINDLVSTIGGLDATFVTVTANPTLVNERVLTAGTGISIVDGGAGGPITVSVLEESFRQRRQRQYVARQCGRNSVGREWRFDPSSQLRSLCRMA